MDPGSGSGAAGRILLWQSLLIGFGQSIDNLMAGMGYALSNRPLSWHHNALIALVNAAGTLFTMVMGDQVLQHLPGEEDGRSARIIGGYILIGLGVKELLCGGGDRTVSGDTEQAASGDDDGQVLAVSVDDRGSQSRRLQLEVVVLAFGLTFTNLAGGFAAGIAGLPPVAVCIMSFVRHCAPNDCSSTTHQPCSIVCMRH